MSIVIYIVINRRIYSVFVFYIIFNEKKKNMYALHFFFLLFFVCRMTNKNKITTIKNSEEKKTMTSIGLSLDFTIK